MRITGRFAVALAAFVLGCAPAWAEQVRVTLLHVNDIYEYKPVQGRGGLAELATLVAAERARAPDAVFSFGGDLLFPSLMSSVTEGSHMVDLLNALGVDVATLGNHEFDHGADNAARQMRRARFPWLAANVFGADGAPFGGAQATLLREVGGVKIGFFGLLTTRTASLSSAEGVRLTPETEAARAAVAQLRAQGAEVVVALTHLGLDDDRRLAREVAGIDLILGGHDHDPASIAEAGPLVLKAGADAHYLGAVELVVERPDPGAGGATRVYPAAWRFVSTAGVAPDPRLAPLIAQYDSLLDGALGQPVATTTTSLDSRAATVRTREAAIGNLIADALRARLGTEVALVNGGGIRGNRQYPAGTVLTRGDLRAELPFNNVAVALSVSGAQLRAALEFALSGVENGAGRFPQVSGLKVVYDPARPPGSRVLSVTIGGQKLADDRRYSLATTDYLARGGDGNAAFKGAPPLVGGADGPMLADLVISHAAAAGTIAPVVEGRVKTR